MGEGGGVVMDCSRVQDGSGPGVFHHKEPSYLLVFLHGRFPGCGPPGARVLCALIPQSL